MKNIRFEMRCEKVKKVVLILSALILMLICVQAYGEDAMIRAFEAYENKCYVEALECWTKAGEEGNSAAMYYIGNLYYNGYGVSKNDETAAEWYKKAAERGSYDAMKNLSIMYSNGWGVPKDAEAADMWHRKALENGYGYLTNNRGIISNNEVDIELIKRAEEGNPMAMNSLGSSYEHGLGVPQDYMQAAYWYQRAAESGDEFAPDNLGRLYEEGLGVPQDSALADYWYSIAVEKYLELAEQGYPYGDIMLNLSYMYAYGKGVEQSAEKEMYWLQKSAEAGSIPGMISLADNYLHGDMTDYEKAIFWYSKASDAGSIEGMINLAYIYKDGLFVEQNNEKALEYYNLAFEISKESAEAYIYYTKREAFFD